MEIRTENDNLLDEQKKLTNLLNRYRNAYYNQNESLISDKDYDLLYDKLVELEKKTNIVMSNSPTNTVGYEVISELPKITHSHAMQSLDKTKSVDDLRNFAEDEDCIFSLKMDGLTVLLTYDNGELVQAETRGNGTVGELITHNAKVFENIPLQIKFKGHLEIEGEAIITYIDFNLINETIKEELTKEGLAKGLKGEDLEQYVKLKSYKNPRNLASGSVRQLDSSIASKRHIKFIVWKVPNIDLKIGLSEYYNSFCGRLKFVEELGFDVVPHLVYQLSYKNDLESQIETLKELAKENSYPIDGLVMTYNDIEYGKSLGSTNHHPKHSIAFKFEDEEVFTTLREVEFSIGKTGTLTPVAIFDTVEIDNTEVNRASLHNLTIMKNLDLAIGDTITVYKANQIIPQIKENLKAGAFERGKIVTAPYTCPSCGARTVIVKENDTEVLKCTNKNCIGIKTKLFSHFVSRDAMNIVGLSEETISKLISAGYLNHFNDIYQLHRYAKDLEKLEGFGSSSVKKLLSNIENSKNTTLDRFIYALSIPNLGKSKSKVIAKEVIKKYGEQASFIAFSDMVLSGYDFTQLDDIGEEIQSKIKEWVGDETHAYRLIMIGSLELEYLNYDIQVINEENQKLKGKNFVITGKLLQFSNRKEAQEKIEKLGGKVVGSVSAKTDYLVNNDLESTSSKNKKAKELGIPIISEEDLIKML